MKKLIIVESPAKSKIIKSYLGKDYDVTSTMGHIRDLATSGPGGLGIDLDTFEPHYINIRQRAKVIADLKKLATGKEVLIATDPDREGEAIGWHLAQILELDESNLNRIEFREITKPAILEALKKPRKIDQGLVDSQEARRMLDRIIGFKLSKLLQYKRYSKSAGRVQSVALKLIVELEEEIRNFIKETYYEVDAHFGKFDAKYIIPANKRLSKEDATLIKNESSNKFVVDKIEDKKSRRYARPAFTTSTLIQEANNRLNMRAARTTSVAQQLYEGIDLKDELVGLITYMRTDSTRLSPIFINQTKKKIEEEYGKEYVGKYRPRTKEDAQDAHEAIRPTNINKTPEMVKPYLKRDQYRLYKLIYDRTIASLMPEAVFDVREITLNANNHLYELKGIKLDFPGYLKAFDDLGIKDKELPDLKSGESIQELDIEIIEKETQPKARYSEATFIRELEKQQIGRPSTYSPTINTLISRSYVELDQRRLVPTEQGMEATKVLDEFFPSIMDIKYTILMEKDLDEIELGKANGKELLRDFYNRFSEQLDNAYENMPRKPLELLEELCPKCGSPLIKRRGPNGEFIGCSSYPECDYIKPKPDPKVLEELCPLCGKPLVVRIGPKGPFIGCSGFPSCKYTRNVEKIE